VVILSFFSHQDDYPKITAEIIQKLKGLQQIGIAISLSDACCLIVATIQYCNPLIFEKKFKDGHIPSRVRTGR